MITPAGENVERQNQFIRDDPSLTPEQNALCHQWLLAFFSRDYDQLERLRPKIDAMRIEQARAGDVETARLLYERGVDIDPALCQFAPAPPRKFPPPPRRIRRRAGLARALLLRLVVLLPLFAGICLLLDGQWIAMIALAAFGGALNYIVWISPVREARLIRRGHVVDGIINKVSVSGRDFKQQTVNYTYSPDGEDRQWGTTSGPLRPRARRGQRVSVFYDPRRPHRSVACEFCDFETDTSPG